MLGVITRIVGNSDVAEEVLKVTFTARWSRIGVYNASKERLLSWGLSIARGLAFEALKTDRYAAILQAGNGNAKINELSNKSVPLQDHATGNRLVHPQPPVAEQALELLYLKGRTCAETAAELGITAEQLREILKKAFTTTKAEKSV